LCFDRIAEEDVAQATINDATTMSGEAVPTLTPSVEVQPFDAGGVILDTVTGQLFSCNHVTMTYLGLVDGMSSIDMLAAAVAEHYEMSPEIVARDLIEISIELANVNLLTLR
jgi:hypothetical protein